MGYTVAVVTYYVDKITVTCSHVYSHVFDTIIATVIAMSPRRIKD